METKIENIKSFIKKITQPFDEDIIECHYSPLSLKNNYFLLILSRDGFENGVEYSYVKIGICLRSSPTKGNILHWYVASELPKSICSKKLQMSYGETSESLIVFYNEIMGITLTAISNVDLSYFEQEIKNNISSHEVVSEAVKWNDRVYSKVIKKNNYEFRLIFNARTKKIDIQYVPPESIKELNELFSKDSYIESAINEFFIYKSEIRKPFKSIFQIY